MDPDSLPLPVEVIGAGPNLKPCFIPPGYASGARSVDCECVSGTTHLAQLEQPREGGRLALVSFAGADSARVEVVSNRSVLLRQPVGDGGREARFPQIFQPEGIQREMREAKHRGSSAVEHVGGNFET